MWNLEFGIRNLEFGIQSLEPESDDIMVLLVCVPALGTPHVMVTQEPKPVVLL